MQFLNVFMIVAAGMATFSLGAPIEDNAASVKAHLDARTPGLTHTKNDKLKKCLLECVRLF